MSEKDNILHVPSRTSTIPIVKKEVPDEAHVESHLSLKDQKQADHIARQILVRHRPTYNIPGTDIILESEPRYDFNIPHDWEVLNAAYDGTIIKDKSYWRNLAVKKAMRKYLAKDKHSPKQKLKRKKYSSRITRNK